MSAFRKLKRKNNEMNLHDEMQNEFLGKKASQDAESVLKRQKI